VQIQTEPIDVPPIPKTARLFLLLIVENLEQESFADFGISTVYRKGMEECRERFVFKGGKREFFS
jgi:hypothetical protein